MPAMPEIVARYDAKLRFFGVFFLRIIFANVQAFYLNTLENKKNAQ